MTSNEILLECYCKTLPQPQIMEQRNDEIKHLLNFDKFNVLIKYKKEIKLNPKEALEVVARILCISDEDLNTRKREAVFCRWIAAGIIRTQCHLPYTQIAPLVGVEKEPTLLNGLKQLDLRFRKKYKRKELTDMWDDVRGQLNIRWDYVHYRVNYKKRIK